MRVNSMHEIALFIFDILHKNISLRLWIYLISKYVCVCVCVCAYVCMSVYVCVYIYIYIYIYLYILVLGPPLWSSGQSF